MPQPTKLQIDKRNITWPPSLFKLHFFHKGRGMMMSPDLIHVYQKQLDKIEPGASSMDPAKFIQNRWGLISGENGVYGLNTVRYEDFDVGAVGCVVCHSGKAAGEFIVGLGSKNVDVVRMAKDLNRLEKWWKVFGKKIKRNQKPIKM
ncbi:MAG: hypothetical protein R2827_12435 [Bdellovibrionales bacterium]